ncbi:MAG: efflux RND transporter permease subunit, partial [Chloroflexi bacterium]|nr:efflux RND transporter permease subunit [Chloroflexota bacterium]
VQMPLGTSVKDTLAKAVELETAIKKNANDFQIAVYYTTVGSSASSMSAMGGSGGGSSTASIDIRLNSGANVDEEAAKLRDLFQPLAGSATIDVNASGSLMGSFGASAFEVDVRGDNYDSVKEAADELAASLQQVDGLTDIKEDVAQTVPEPKVTLDNAKVNHFAAIGRLDAGALQGDLTDMMAGTGLKDASLNGKSIFVEGVMDTAQTTEDLEGLVLSGGLELKDIASVQIISEPTSIARMDQQRSATITGLITAKDVGSVNSAAQAKIDSLSVPGVDASVGGIQEEMQSTFRNMGIAIIIAIFIAFAIVVVSFRSIISPLIIMGSLPLAAIGALVGLAIAGRPIGAVALMGVLMLVGIVLTNAIVLVAYVEQLRKKGVSTHEALIEGGRIRLRPILMTALCTMVALIPMALGIGEGVLLASELAIVVIGGLFSSTLLTLVVIPVLYSLTDRFRRQARA